MAQEALRHRQEAKLNMDWAAWTGVAALVLILWERLSRRFTWFMLCRTLPYVANEYEQSVFRPLGRTKRRWLWFLSLLWPRPYQVFGNELVCRYLGFEPEITPLPVDPESAFMEARLYAESRDKRRQRQPAISAHRDGYFKQRIKCANGCGTPYGKTRSGFSTDAPPNGWTCVSPKCSLREPHYCGRCDAEPRGLFAEGMSEVRDEHGARL